MIWDRLFKKKGQSKTDKQAKAEKLAEEEAKAALLAEMSEWRDASEDLQDTDEESTDGSFDDFEEDEIPDELLEDFGKRFEQLESDINLRKQMAEKLVVPDDIDTQIEQLLAKDADEPVESEGKTDFVSEVSIYNEEKGIIPASELTARDPEEVKSRRKAAEGEPSISLIEKIMNLPVKTMYMIMGVMGVLILSFGITTLVLANRVHKAEMEGKKLIHPMTAGNSSNYLYISEQVIIEGEPLVLDKVLVGGVCTQFYFTRYFDAFHYDITLFDDKEKVYQMDLNYLMGSLTDDKKGPTILRFESFDPQIKEFTLRIHDPLTEQDMDFRVAFDKELVLPAPRFVNEPVEAYVDDDVVIMIEPSYFSRADSVIRYSIQWRNNHRGVEFSSKLRKEDEDRNFTLIEEARTVLRKDIVPVQYTFPDEKLILGRVDFDPLTNLDARIKLTIHNLFRTFEVNASIPTDKLVLDEEGKEEIINLGPYRIVMERIVTQGNLVVLVFHTEEKITIPDDLEEGTVQTATQRVWAEMDAELNVTFGSGVQGIIKGINFSGDIGTDVVFNLNAYDGFNIGTPKDMTIEIKSVSLKMSDVTVPIDLYTHGSIEEGEAAEVKQFIKDAFEKRLLYKSGKAKKDELTGFAPSVLDDAVGTTDYSPVANAGQAKYSVDVSVSHLSEQKATAIVKETWAAPGSYRTDVFYRVHKVEAAKNQGRWQITADEPANRETKSINDRYFSQ